MGRERLSLGELAARADEGFWAWSGYAVERLPTVTRRDLLKWGGVATFLYAIDKFRLRILENMATARELPRAELSALINQAAKHTQEWGIYPDLEKVGADVWGIPDQAKEEIGREDFVGFFALLEDIDKPESLESKREVISTIIARGARPVVSLGTSGETLEGHPFSPENASSMNTWIRKWASFLNTFDVELDVRFLFEMNLDHGYVSYHDDGTLPHDLHVNRFKDLFDYFYQQLGADSKVRLAFCPSSAGVGAMEYVPTRGVKAVGVNLFDFTEGKNGIGWFNLIRGLAYMEWEVGQAYGDMRDSSQRTGNVPMYIYEIGSLTHEVGWLEQTVARFFAMGGRGIGYFNYDKAYTGRSTETDWTLSSAELRMFANLFARIEKVRKRSIRWTALRS